MSFDESILKNDEKAVFELRRLYKDSGYSQFKMSKFEEYDLYSENKDFLVSDGVITFNDTIKNREEGQNPTLKFLF